MYNPKSTVRCDSLQVMTGQMLGVTTAVEPGQKKKKKKTLTNHGLVALPLKCIPSFSMELDKNRLAKAGSS